MEISRLTYSSISHLREKFLRENNIQFVLDKCYRYRWADAYAFIDRETPVGYGSVYGTEKREDRDTIFEFYLMSEHRDLAEQCFLALCRSSKAPYIECQTNDKFLYPLFEKFTTNIQTETILFAEHHTTNFRIDNASLVVRPQSNPDDCQFVLMHNGKEVGEGGFMLNYNFPYADMYYGIHEKYRGKGFGGYFVQELKAEIYKMNRVPAARCNPSNAASKATLLKAGMAVCGERLKGVGPRGV